MPHVLVVEPTPRTRSADAIVVPIPRIGFTIETRSREELSKCLGDGEGPSVVVLPLDVRMTPVTEAAIREVRARCPKVPVVVYIPTGPDGASILAMARAGAQHFAFDRADDLAKVLREVVRPEGRKTPSQLEAERRLEALPQLARRLLEVAMSHDPPLQRVPALARAMALPTRSVRRMLAHRGWPPPKVLLDAGRALRALLALADGVPQADAAVCAGFTSSRGVLRALRRLALYTEAGRMGQAPFRFRGQLQRLLDMLDELLVPRKNLRTSDGRRAI